MATQTKKYNHTNISRHRQPIKQQHHTKKQGYIVGHLKSNTKCSTRHPQWSCHYEKPQRVALKKEIRVLKAPLFLVIVWSRYLHFIQKIRKNEIQLHVQKFLKCY